MTPSQRDYRKLLVGQAIYMATVVVVLSSFHLWQRGSHPDLQGDMLVAKIECLVCLAIFVVWQVLLVRQARRMQTTINAAINQREAVGTLLGIFILLTVAIVAFLVALDAKVAETGLRGGHAEVSTGLLFGIAGVAGLLVLGLVARTIGRIWRKLGV